MAASRVHLTALPPGFITVRVMQLLFTLATLSLTIFMVIEKGYSAQYVVMITAAFTLIALIWIILAGYVIPRAYNYWAVLVIEILFFAAWVNGFFFSLASHFNADSGCLYTYNYSTQTTERHCKDDFDESRFSAAANSSFSVQGFAGSLLVLWLVSMIVVSVFIARHRRAGGHCKPGSEAPLDERS
ncbi:hypothetical protein BGZ60DRAFT_518864 [Tricladium varicosporioides]|nr:hypothetical protein BGZ60DRAFT_518864 [Hymenoscyphus varicosporioides]